MATLLENVTLSFSFFLAFSFIMKIKSLNKEFFPLRINHMLEGLQVVMKSCSHGKNDGKT